MDFEYFIPDENTPGWIARDRKRLAFIDAVGTPESSDRLIDWLLDYITKPKDRKAARAALENASLSKIKKMQRDIVGIEQVDPKESESSDSG